MVSLIVWSTRRVSVVFVAVVTHRYAQSWWENAHPGQGDRQFAAQGLPIGIGALQTDRDSGFLVGPATQSLSGDIGMGHADDRRSGTLGDLLKRLVLRLASDVSWLLASLVFVTVSIRTIAGF